MRLSFFGTARWPLKTHRLWPNAGSSAHCGVPCRLLCTSKSQSWLVAVHDLLRGGSWSALNSLLVRLRFQPRPGDKLCVVSSQPETALAF
jgi:hypothetical protein